MVGAQRASAVGKFRDRCKRLARRVRIEHPRAIYSATQPRDTRHLLDWHYRAVGHDFSNGHQYRVRTNIERCQIFGGRHCQRSAPDAGILAGITLISSSSAAIQRFIASSPRTASSFFFSRPRCFFERRHQPKTRVHRLKVASRLVGDIAHERAQGSLWRSNHRSASTHDARGVNRRKQPGRG
jgi:hypothetical protein